MWRLMSGAWLLQVPVSPTELTEIVKAFAQFGILGWVTVLLGKRFLQTSDDDRKYIRDQGQAMSLALQQMSATNTSLVATNAALVATNGELVKSNQMMVESHKELLHAADRLVARVENLEAQR